jgi:hypothetical protein
MPSVEGDITELRRAAEERAEEIRAGVNVTALTEQLREFGETGILKLTSDPVRADILDEAKQAVCSDRNAEYGEPIENFSRWAGACNALGYRRPDGGLLKPHDLAVIMGLGKLSRSVQSPDKRDTWVDLAGYAAVGGELVTLED